MSYSLKFDSTTGDLALTNGKLETISTKEEITKHQMILRLNTIRGTWYRNITTGLPLLKNKNNPVQILGNVPKIVFDSYVIEEMLKCEYAEEVTEYSSVLDRKTGDIEVTATVLTDSGSINIDSLPLQLI